MFVMLTGRYEVQWWTISTVLGEAEVGGSGRGRVALRSTKRKRPTARCVVVRDDGARYCWCKSGHLVEHKERDRRVDHELAERPGEVCTRPAVFVN